MRWINKFFKLEEINGHNACPTYLYRWTLLRLGKLSAVYLHHFVGDDWTQDLHDHPKRFISIGIKGGYVEQTPNPDFFTDNPENYSTDTKTVTETPYIAPFIRSFPAEYIHRLRMLSPGSDCWTIVIVLRAKRNWGFWKDGQFVGWREYVKPGNSRPACD